MEGIFYGVVGRGRGKGSEGEEAKERAEGEEDINREEVREVLRKMKDGKVMGLNGILGEVWRYGGDNLEK